MSTLIRGGLVLPLDSRKPVARRADLLIEADTIAKVGDGLNDRGADTVIDGRDMLVMPGLVNAHAHSFDALLKGRYDNLPLEVWIPRVAPVVDPPVLSPRLVYLRTMLLGMEGPARRGDVHPRRRRRRIGAGNHRCWRRCSTPTTIWVSGRVAPWAPSTGPCSMRCPSRARLRRACEPPSEASRVWR